MRALRKSAAAPGLTLDEVPIPAVGPGDVLIEVMLAGVCGTDRHIEAWDGWAQRRISPPLVLGHEFVGRIAALGENVEGLALGERVSAEGHVACGRCRACRTGDAHICAHVKIIGVDRDGAFASFVSVPAGNVWRLDPRVPDHVAAIFDPLGNAVHTVMAAGVSGKTVAVTGVGSIGLMAIPVARAVGAARVYATDVSPEKLDLARRLGADDVFDARDPETPAAIIARSGGEGIDVLLEMSGSAAAIDAGLGMLRNGGRAALLGIPPDDVRLALAERIIFKGLTVLGINGRRMYETWYQTEALVLGGRIDLAPILTHRLPLAEHANAFALVANASAAKVVLDIAGAA